MSQNSLFLEPDLQFRFEAACFQDGLLNPTDYVYSDFYSLPPAYRDPKLDLGILPFVSLYPSLHCTISEIGLSKVAERSGLEISLLEPAYVRLMNFCSLASVYASDSPERLSFLRRLEFAHDEATLILLSKKSQFLELIPNLISEDFGKSEIDIFGHEEKISCLILIRNFYGVLLDRLFEYYRSDLTGSILQSSLIVRDLSVAGRVHPLTRHPYFEALLLQLESMYLRLVAEIFISTVGDSEYLDFRPFGHISSEGRGRATALKVLAGLELGINILPNPRTIREAVDLSHTKPVSRLRELLEQWTLALYSGSEKMEAKVRRDINVASRDMRNLSRLKAYKESPFGLAFRFIGGQVPILSNILSVSELLIYFAERKLESRSCWISLAH